jgi:hypothetical protein
VTVAKLRHSDAMPALRREMREATRPLQPGVRQAVRSLPSGHSRYKAAERGGSLRTAVAGSIVRKLRVGQRRVSVVIAEVPRGGKSNLANVLEGTIPWEHPTYGRDPVQHQDPHPFFYNTIEKMVPAINRRIETVLDQFERML